MSETILIIDDTETNRYAFSRLLGKAGYNTLQAETLKDGMAHLMASHVDLIILDVNLPDGTGFDMCVRIKSQPEHASIPVLMTSALFIEGRDRAHGLESGADGYLTTPIDSLELVATVRSLLRISDAETKLKEALLKAERANNAKTEFLANMSHEIRTPMNAIVGIATLLGRTPLNPQQQKFIATLQQSADSLLALVNDLLDISKIENNKIDLEALPFRPSEVILHVFKLLTSQAMEKGITLDAPMGPDTRLQLIGDQQRIYQVVVNLVSNAVKFTATGGVRIETTVTPDDEGFARLAITVTDTGIGIAPDHLDQIFDKFVQADSSTTRRYGGTGLGLPIARSLSERMGGSLTVTSEPDKGSVFTFALRLKIADAVDAPAESVSEQGRTTGGGRVLLVEDNAANIVVATALLDDLGYDHVTVGTGQEALDILQKQGFDLVLMDVQMDGMDGFETTRRFRQSESERGAGRLAIVAMTAYGMAGDRDKCLQAGMDDYLAKPINITQFEALIGKYVGMRKAQH